MSSDKADQRPPDQASKVVLPETLLPVHETKLNGLI